MTQITHHFHGSRVLTIRNENDLYDCKMSYEEFSNFKDSLSPITYPSIKIHYKSDIEIAYEIGESGYWI